MHENWQGGQGRRGRGAQKSCAPDGGAGRSKNVKILPYQGADLIRVVFLT